jgi:hypothetical protein
MGEKTSVHRFEGLWWKQEKNVTGFVALTNVGQQPIDAIVRITDDNEAQLGSRRITVSPGGTKMIDLYEIGAAAGNAGGIYVDHDGPEHSLAINGGLSDATVGYSAHLGLLPVPEPVEHRTQLPADKLEYAEVGLMTGLADPMMSFPNGTAFAPYSVIRNISPTSVPVTPTLWWMEAGAPRTFAGTKFTIAAHRTMSLDLPGLLAAAGQINFNGSINLILETTAQPGDLALSAGSVDGRNTYVFDVIPRALTESAARSIPYWSTANGDDTMVTLWNPADEDQDLTYTLFFSGGHYNYPIHLAPRTTRSFNISEITRIAIPDADGNIIPAGIREGSAEIAGILGENQHILVSMGTGIYNVDKAICNAPTCETCQGIVSSSLTDNPFYVPLSSTKQEHLYMQWSGGLQYDLTNSSTWTTSNSSVAQVNNGVVTGVSLGSVSITAHTLYTEPPYIPNYCYMTGNGACPTGGPVSGSATGTVPDSTPTITGINPSDWVAGTNQSVTLQGQYFGTNAPTLSFSPSVGISYTLSSYNDTTIVALVTVASGTPNEQVTVSVTNNGYGGSSFNGGSIGQSPTSVPVHATVHSPINSPEITVIAWVNGQAPDLLNLPTGANTTLVTDLNMSPASCGFEVFQWSILLIPTDLSTSTDKAYANAFLLKHSANAAPPSTITPSAQQSAGDFRLFNDFGHGLSYYQVGITPDPCGASVPASVLVWVGTGQSSPYIGPGTSASGQVYQLAEGRIGTLGQRGSQTINGRTVAWIWNVIEFDSAGNPTYSDHATFPTYSVYQNGILVATYPQGSVASFVALDQTSQRTPSQIP